MKKYLPVIIVAALLVFGGAAALLLTNSSKPESSNSSSQITNKPASPNPTSPEPEATNEVNITGFAFTPADIKVKKGTTVTWTNNDTTQHTVTADGADGPNSKALNQGDKYVFMFEKTGTYTYHCNFHNSMQATVTVTE